MPRIAKGRIRSRTGTTGPARSTRGWACGSIWCSPTRPWPAWSRTPGSTARPARERTERPRPRDRRPEPVLGPAIAAPPERERYQALSGQSDTRETGLASARRGADLLRPIVRGAAQTGRARSSILVSRSCPGRSRARPTGSRSTGCAVDQVAIADQQPMGAATSRCVSAIPSTPPATSRAYRRATASKWPIRNGPCHSFRRCAVRAAQASDPR